MTILGEPATEMLWNGDTSTRVRVTVTGCAVGYGNLTFTTSGSPPRKLDWARKGGTDEDRVAASTCRYGSAK